VAYEMLAVAIANDNARIPYYAPTRDDARDIMWGILQIVAKNAIIDKNEARLELTIRNKFNGKSLIALYGWEAVQERKKGVGVKNNFIVLDEVSKYRNFWTGWQEVLRPTLTDLRGGAMMISTPNGYNHFFDLCNQELKDEDFKTFHFTSYDNPHIPVEEIDKAKKELPEEKFSQEYLASFQKTSGLVYKEFDRKIHLYDELPKIELKKIGGLDFGYRNPAGLLDIRTNGEKFYIEDEWYKTGKTDAEIAEYTSSYRFEAVYPDPENPAAIEELKRRGVNCRDVRKDKDSIQYGIKKIKELFLTGRLKINKKCVNLIAELEMYCYEENEKKEKPKKENDHLLDALRYVVIMIEPSQNKATISQLSVFQKNRQNILNNSTR